MSRLVESYDPDEGADTHAHRAGAIGVYQSFAGIPDDAEAVRRFERMKPRRQSDHIAEFASGLRWFKRAGGRI